MSEGISQKSENMMDNGVIVALRQAEQNIIDQISTIIRAAERQAAESMREKCADEALQHRHCRLVDAMTGQCDCREIAADIRALPIE